MIRRLFDRVRVLARQPQAQPEPMTLGTLGVGRLGSGVFFKFDCDGALITTALARPQALAFLDALIDALQVQEGEAGGGAGGETLQ